MLHQLLALGGGDGADLAARRHHVDALGDGGAAFFVQEADQGFTHGQFGDGGFDVQARVGAHGGGRGLDGLLVARGEGAQRVLHAVAQLGQHAVGNVQRVLGDKVHPHALGTHQAHHQLDAFEEHLGRVVEQQVGLVEEEDQLGLVGVADFGQLLEQLGQHPQQEGGVQARRVHQLVGRQDVDHAVAPGVGLHQVFDVEHGLAEELVAAFALDLQQAALDGAHAGGADVAVFGGELLGVVAHMLEHGAQVLEVQQQHAAVVGDLEDDVQHAHLRVVQVQHAAQQQRAHVGHGGAHRVALLAEHVPQGRGAGRGGGQGDAAVLQRGGQLVADAAGLADAAQVALDVGHEHRHARLGKAFGHLLQGDRLARARCTGDQAVAVGQAGEDVTVDITMLGNQEGGCHICHMRVSSWGEASKVKSDSID